MSENVPVGRLVIASDPVAVVRAVGLLKAFVAKDEEHIGDVLAAVNDDPDPNAHGLTFGALTWLCAFLAHEQARTRGCTASDVLDHAQHDLITIITEGIDNA